MEWSIQQIAKIAGTTSRTLRHYDDIGLLAPTRIGVNGYRHYDQRALVTLQRILLLREMGLGLPQIGEVLQRSVGQADALSGHLAWLRQEQDRLARQVAAVQSTIDSLRGGEQLMAENMFDGFDHTQYRDEVEQRWGRESYATGDSWWRGMSPAEQESWKGRVAELSTDWVRAAEAGLAPDSDEAQTLAARHVAWLTSVPGTPASAPDGDVKAYVIGLGEMYVADPRFGANYATAASGDDSGAAFVRDALRVYADAHL